MELTSGDFLAGGGGVTYAMKNSGLKVKWVLNHSQVAIRTNMHNNKGIKHYLANFYTQDEHEMEPVDFVWASIECTQHSRANGGREKKIGSYTLGWELKRYVRFLQPSCIGIENVPEFKDWAPLRIKEDKKHSTKVYSALLVDTDGEFIWEPNKERKGEEFERWKAAICALGYEYSEYINNAADFGIPTRRVRYFAFFTKKHLQLNWGWPAPTHSKDGKNGLKKWVACKSFIDLTNEGESIFGRKFNPNIKKGHRKELCPNTRERIAGGVDKYAPELAFIFQYYGSGKNIQSLKSPLNTVTTKDRHVLVTMEKLQFIADHCHTDNYHTANEPMNPILTRQTKQLVSTQFISHQYNSNGNPEANNQSIDEPLNPITTERKQQFISHHFGSGLNQSLDEPMNSITTHEKIQFISAYFSSSGKQRTQNQSIESPLGTITTGTNKQALISAIENGEFDFDIKMRFLDPEELGQISTFPERYFTDPLLKLTKKEQTKLIGNAVPPEWAKIMIEPVISALQEALQKREVV